MFIFYKMFTKCLCLYYTKYVILYKKYVCLKYVCLNVCFKNVCFYRLRNIANIKL